MAFIASDNGSGDFKRVPVGVFIGRCYSFIDIGTQRVEFQGDVKQQHKIIIRWELFGEDENGEPLTIEVNGKSMPMTISKRYTLSLSDKARLRHDLVSWRGRDFSDEEAKAFDVSRLIGAYCMVNVTHNETNGKTYSNISSLTPLPGALRSVKPEPVHANRMFDLDAPDWEFFESLHENLQDTIKKSVEWGQKYGQPKASAKEYAEASNGGGFPDDDIPF